MWMVKHLNKIKKYSLNEKKIMISTYDDIFSDVFLPCPDNLIVNLKEREELIKDLLAQLPTKFQGTHDTNSALGAALQVAYKLMVQSYNIYQ